MISFRGTNHPSRAETYHNLNLGVMRPHLPNQRGKRRNNIIDILALLHDIIRAQVHADDVGRVLLQPPDELLLAGDVDGQEARVALVVAVVLGVAAVVLRLAGADKVDGRPLGGLELVPELGAPADDLGDGVAEGHVPEPGGCLGGGARREGGEEEGKAEHGDWMEGLSWMMGLGQGSTDGTGVHRSLLKVLRGTSNTQR